MLQSRSRSVPPSAALNGNLHLLRSDSDGYLRQVSTRTRTRVGGRTQWVQQIRQRFEDDVVEPVSFSFLQTQLFQYDRRQLTTVTRSCGCGDDAARVSDQRLLLVRGQRANETVGCAQQLGSSSVAFVVFLGCVELRNGGNG